VINPKITLGVFDSHPLVLHAILRECGNYPDSLEVLFAAQTIADLQAAMKQEVPQLLILDIASPELTGPEFLGHFRQEHPELPVITYAGTSSPGLVESLLFLGTRGFVHKRQPMIDLITTILEVADGQLVVPEEYKYLTTRFRKPHAAMLSEREIEIIQWISRELTSDEIAEKLQLSVNTVESHRKKIFLKLQVKNVAGLILEAIRLGYIHG
jgi:two-component system invasion response regulator UvrY